MKMVANKKKSLFLKTYLAMIANSVETKMFRNFFMEIDGEEKDILENGRLSCAVYVSAILILHGLIQGPPRGPHAILKSLVKNMEDSGWQKIKKPRPGAVLIWEPMKIGERANEHAGFFWKKGEAVSNRLELFAPMKHHWTYGTRKGKPIRKITAIYWHSKLG